MKYRFAATGRLATDFKAYISNKYSPQITCNVFASDQQLQEQITDYNAIAAFTLSNQVNLSHIKWIHSFGAGVDGILQNTSFSSDTIITRTSGKMGQKMGEYCLTYILSDLRNVIALHNQQQQKIWEPLPYADLHKQRILIFGTGTIGRPIAQIVGPLCQQLDGVSLSGIWAEGFHKVVKMDQIKSLKDYDIIINTLPLTELTRKYFNSNLFSSCQNALLINVGRGESVDQDALIRALNSGNLRKAVLDVFDNEPLPKASRLWSHDKVIITPHNASKTSLSDVMDSFEKIYQDLKNNKLPALAVDLKRGY